MERIIQKIGRTMPVQPKLTRVAAYARVSSGKDAMLHSLSSQVSYYSEYIQKHQGWQYCGVYADEAKTGTKANRTNFQRLLDDCRAGKIDLVITKSISRFARNTITLLETIRELKSISVDVYFEEQNIHTMSADGELMLTFLAAYAQEESRSVSENCKWRIRKQFEQGIQYSSLAFGYKLVNGELKVEPSEAKIVVEIFNKYLSGKGYLSIAHELNDAGIKTRFGNEWSMEAISRTLKNYTYTGNLILQKTFRENHITKKRRINKGELKKYHVENSHEPIIDLATFEDVQAEILERAAKYSSNPATTERYGFTSLVTCGICGKHYRRKIKRKNAVWICPTYNSHGKAACPSKAVPESVLEELATEIGLDEISGIIAENNNKLTFRLNNGDTIEKHWCDRSRSESWTPEMKERARQQALNRKRG